MSTRPNAAIQTQKRPVSVTIALLFILVVAANLCTEMFAPVSTHVTVVTFTAKKQAIIPKQLAHQHDLTTSGYDQMRPHQAVATSSLGPHMTGEGFGFDTLLVGFFIALIIIAISPIIFTICAILMLRRARRARLIYTIFAALGLPALAAIAILFEETILAAASAALMVASIVLLFLPTSNRWFNQPAS